MIGNRPQATRLIEGISYSRQNSAKFMRLTHRTSPPLIAIKGKNAQDACVDISLSLQDSLLLRNTVIYGPEVAQEVDSDEAGMSVSKHVAISSLLVSTTPIRAAQVVFHREEPRLRRESSNAVPTTQSQMIELEEVQNADGLTISDVTRHLLGNPPDARRSTFRPFLGVKLETVADESPLESSEITNGRQLMTSSIEPSLATAGVHAANEATHRLILMLGPLSGIKYF